MTDDEQKSGLKEEKRGFAQASALRAAYSAPLKAVIGEGGRLVIPADMRKLMDIQTGDTVSLRIEDGVLRVVSPKMALRRVQQIARKLKKPGESVVDEFLAGRREEQRRSDERFDRLEREVAMTAEAKKG